MSQTPNDPLDNSLAVAFTAAVQADERVRARVISFADFVLDEAEHLLRHGAPQVKLRLIQTVISVSVRDASRQTGEDEKMSALRESVDGLFANVREAIAIPQGVAGDAREDRPNGR